MSRKKERTDSPQSPRESINRASGSDSSLQSLLDQARASANQLSATEYGFVMGLLAQVAPTNLLVFGLGRDSPLWASLNAGGRTAFLEDDPTWFHSLPNAETFLVKYPNLELPASIQEARWNVILVDGPAGYRPTDPGRRESIEAAARLVAQPGGVICVHDVNRPAEDAYCRQYLGVPHIMFDRMAVYLMR